MAKHRHTDDPSDPRQSKAARLNVRVLDKLQKAVNDNPEVDLLTLFPRRYSQRLAESIPFVHEPAGRERKTPRNDEKEDIRDFLSPSDPVEIIFPFSPAVSTLLDTVSETVNPLPQGLSQRLYELLRRSETVWKAPFANQKGVYICSPDIVVKVVSNLEDATEYTTLQYLEQHKSDIPAPRPLGMARMNDISLIFMSHEIGLAWTSMGHPQLSPEMLHPRPA
ncbi:hypothetical protein NUU61_003347 [Penicillium alfredii]|uniref:Uncharacterized protein n=1 Tax=Penicillium alfredii TaxID=1506179 RepID=A0A9W9FT98_9EURO|nr:uncharacterized protein NUU61_003347 [Penicillium alfredii]KAJ5106000.1 hypothetical protein NUU61_003347 [Penicillium alfredii]